MGFANMSDNTASPAAAAPATSPSTGSRRWLGLVLGLCVSGAVVGGLGWFFHHKPAAPVPELALEKLGVSRPDALLETASLSQLPKDLLSVPFLRDTLTEDFVFYYETHGDRLGLIGSLRRIIYEHDLAWCRWPPQGFPAGNGSWRPGQAARAAGARCLG